MMSNISDLKTYRNIKKTKEHIDKLVKTRDNLISAMTLIAEDAQQDRQIAKAYNELGTVIQSYANMIDTYQKHVDRMERNNDGF